MVEADPLPFPKQEIEYIPIKEETPEWDMPDDHDSIRDPLSIIKEECSSSEDFLSSRALSIKEEEDRKDKDTMREDDFQFQYKCPITAPKKQIQDRTKWRNLRTGQKSLLSYMMKSADTCKNTV
ncbi:uncharacterized protein LOC126210602 isoform X6 [Schistocerca nitens]|uniref:uncharacterized protein LOC126210602 isoform X6 n=1 Tax=Schistocerca nitens TaxID=7011 RepID=UPI0021188190|nr:uncharacterized protein LOC126210602 isoform X6 [Schistocerca nitens]